MHNRQEDSRQSTARKTQILGFSPPNSNRNSIKLSEHKVNDGDFTKKIENKKDAKTKLHMRAMRTDFKLTRNEKLLAHFHTFAGSDRLTK